MSEQRPGPMVNPGPISDDLAYPDFADRLSRVSVAAESLRRARTELRLALESARPHHTLEQLGKAAGVSRQAVHGMLKQKEEK